MITSQLITPQLILFHLGDWIQMNRGIKNGLHSRDSNPRPLERKYSALISILKVFSLYSFFKWILFYIFKFLFLNDLSGNVWSLVWNSGHAVCDDRFSFRNREKEFVVHSDVSAQHDAVGNLQIKITIKSPSYGSYSLFCDKFYRQTINWKCKFI